jgi:hypothetical protein
LHAQRPPAKTKAPHGADTERTFDDEPPVQLRITPQGVQRRDAIRIKAEVINRSSTPVVWDSAWSVFLAWHLLPDDDLFALTRRTVRRIRQTPQSLSKARFIAIPPGQRLPKIFVLTQPFRAFHVETDAGIPGIRHSTRFFGYESMDEYHIPRHVKRLRVTWVYSASLRASEAFYSMFGYGEEKVNLRSDKWASNTLTLMFQ